VLLADAGIDLGRSPTGPQRWPAAPRVASNHLKHVEGMALIDAAGELNGERLVGSDAATITADGTVRIRADQPSEPLRVDTPLVLDRA
jgi:hypothetical protein